jgi:hypothetical protein
MASAHVPALRWGKPYESLEQVEVRSYQVSQVNAGLIRRDLRRAEEHARVLQKLSTSRMLKICQEAGEQFLNGSLPLGDGGEMQSADDYVALVSETSGLPHNMARGNMQKVYTVLTEMPKILHGLTRGMPPAILDQGIGEQDGMLLCFAPTSDSLGVVLPSNSPGVNSIWLPALALRVPVILKPGRDEPWTPWRIVQAFLAAGCPPEAFGYYPTDHEGAAAILEGCGRALLFGDERTTATYAANPAIQIHGPGRSKVLLGADESANFAEYLDVIEASVADNGGRSCINASAIFVHDHARELAEALAERLGGISVREPADPEARLSAFANPAFAKFIEQSIEQGIAQGGAVDVATGYRSGARFQEAASGTYLLPTVVHCDSLDHLLANTEFLFPFTSVVQVPQDQMLAKIGPSLVVTAISKDPGFQNELLRSNDIDRLNLGPLPTSRVDWDQPHEGNLFEFLRERRAIQKADQW